MIRRTTAVLAATGLLALSACGSSAKTAATTVAAPASTTATTAAAAPATTAAAAPGTTAAAGATTAAPAATTAAPPASEFTAGLGCGLNNGKKAEGAPIKLGNVSTKVPGIDFSTGPAMMDAYFKCVNENGGINGRPLQMRRERQPQA